MIINNNINKTSSIKKIFFIIPIIIFIIGIIAYFFLEPDNKQVLYFLRWLWGDSHNHSLSFIDWLFIDSVPHTDASTSNIIISKRFFWIIWLITFIISLFLLGLKIHKQTEYVNPNAILIMNEPYLLINKIYNKIKYACSEYDYEELNSILYSVKCLKEKLSVESDFGFGDNSIIICENNIAKLLQNLLSISNNIDDINLYNYIKEAKFIIENINSNLVERTELKKN